VTPLTAHPVMQKDDNARNTTSKHYCWRQFPLFFIDSITTFQVEINGTEHWRNLLQYGIVQNR
jgi:hypothetical protein